MEAIRAYIERFDEGPAVIGWEEHEVIAAIEQALAKGEPITEGPETRAPKDTLL